MRLEFWAPFLESLYEKCRYFSWRAVPKPPNAAYLQAGRQRGGADDERGEVLVRQRHDRLHPLQGSVALSL